MMTGNFSTSTPLDAEPTAPEQDEQHALAALEAEQDAHDATVEAESDPHTVLRHTEFYPLDPDTRGWSLAEVDAALALREQDAIRAERWSADEREA
jgi:hypothetical protein